MGESQIVLMIITPLRETLYEYMGFKEAPAFMTIEMMWLNFSNCPFLGSFEWVLFSFCCLFRSAGVDNFGFLNLIYKSKVEFRV